MAQVDITADPIVVTESLSGGIPVYPDFNPAPQSAVDAAYVE